jgi:hypothetical protein
MIPIPSKNDPITASWAAAVTNRCNEKAISAPSQLVSEGVLGNGVSQMKDSQRILREDNPLPFCVRYYSITSNTSGHFAIYLPANSLSIDNQYVSIVAGKGTNLEDLSNYSHTSSETKVKITYPDGWKVIPTLSSPTAVYLHIFSADESSTSSESKIAVISHSSSAQSPGADYTLTHTIVIAKINGKEIKQIVSGALILNQKGEGGGGGSLSGSVSFVAGIRYDKYLHQIQRKIGTLNLATGKVTIDASWTCIEGGQAEAQYICEHECPDNGDDTSGGY